MSTKKTKDLKILLIEDGAKDIGRFIEDEYNILKTKSGKYFDNYNIKFRDTNNEDIIYSAKVYVIKATDYATDIKMLDAKKECLEDAQILIYLIWNPHKKVLERIKGNRQFFFEERKDHIVDIFQNQKDYEIKWPYGIESYASLDRDVQLGACNLQKEIYSIIHFSIERYFEQKCDVKIELIRIKTDEEEEGNKKDSSNYYSCWSF